jgi:hypothetical protein
LNIVHLSDTNIEHCSNTSEGVNMQMLAFEIATTFVDDAAALIGGCGRIIVQILARIFLAPVERMANACDVAGVLANRRLSHALERARQRQPSLKAISRLRQAQRQRSRWLLGFLGDLT